MDIPTAGLDVESTYKLLTGSIVPRPIAWITTLNDAGRVNLAPFSSFTYVSVRPPMLGFHCGRKAGRRKDTAANIHAVGDYVVHIGDMSLVEPLHLSAVEHPPEVSEAELLGLATIPSSLVRTPRLAAAPIAMECRFRRAVEFGESGSEFMVGEILMFHVRDGLIERTKIDSRKLDPIARLAGPRYAHLGEIVTLKPLVSTPKDARTETGGES